jgi:hypothetical protein
MSASYKVLAPYVTLKVKDVVGSDVVQGFYADAVVPDPVDNDNFQKHVRNGWIEKVEGDSAPEPEQPEVVEEAPAFERPAGNASQEAWATYALESGQASEDEVKDLSRDELRELYG